MSKLAPFLLPASSEALDSSIWREKRVFSGLDFKSF